MLAVIITALGCGGFHGNFSRDQSTGFLFCHNSIDQTGCYERDDRKYYRSNCQNDDHEIIPGIQPALADTGRPVRYPRISMVRPRTVERRSAFDTSGTTMGDTLRIFPSIPVPGLYPRASLRFMDPFSFYLESRNEPECDNKHQDVIYRHMETFHCMHQITGLR